MSRKSTIILALLAFGLLSFSILISAFKPQFIYDSLHPDELREEIQSIVDRASSDKDLDSFISSISKIENEKSFSQKRPYEFVIQKGDSIVYWSTNKLDFDKLKTIRKPGVYNLSSRIYWVWQRVTLSQKIYYLIPLKRNLEFENEFLQNTSLSNIYIPQNYLPSQKKNKSEINISVHKQNFKLYFEQLGPDNIRSIWQYILLIMYGFSIVLLIVLLLHFLLKSSLKLYWKIIVWFVILLLTRVFLLSPEAIPFAYDFYLFQAFDFANTFISSLGMLIINVVWLYVLVFYLLKFLEQGVFKISFFQSLFLQLFSFIFLLLIFYSIHNIILNSTSNFVDFSNVLLRYQDILILLVFGLLILLYINILFFIIKRTDGGSPKLFFRSILFLYLPIAVVLLLFDWHLIIFPLFVSLCGLLLSVNSSLFFSRQTISLISIFIGSIVIVSFVEYVSSEKELLNKSLRLENYQVENNRLAEYLLNDLDKSIVNDSTLLGLMYRLPESEQQIYDYIHNQYFLGYWSQYNDDITICGSENIFKAPNDINSCQEFFDKKTVKSSKLLGDSHFVAITDYGIDNYLGRFHYIKQQDSTLIDLYILLKHKEQHENLGYPSFLVSQEVDKGNEPQYYSFAKYKDSNLVSRTGAYNYSLDFTFPIDNKNQLMYVKDGYNHLIEQQAPHVYNVISSRQLTIWDFFIILSYVFVLYVAAFYLVKLFSLFVQFKWSWQNTLKDKLRLSFLGLLIVTFIVVAVAVIYRSAELSEQKQKKVLNEKMQSVLVELMHKLSQSEELENLNPDYINFLLVKFSNVFFTDINLYDLSGELIASSRNVVFEKGLIGKRMNPKAFRYLSVEKKSDYIQLEKIGTQKYLSAYIPFRNVHNKTIAYLNLPYFAKDKEVEADVATLVTAFLNIFVFLFLITGLFTVFITNRITLPLSNIQEKLKLFSLGGKNETIIYNSKDEIGALVTEYNKTVEELNKNIELLAQKEREGAWKEMAKQIAHEIKNPLTPMKLSIQHLKYIWKDESQDRDKKLNDTVDLIVRQIDNLAEIATAFSDFSKMTIAQKSKFDIISLIKDQVELHSKEVIISVSYKSNEPLYINADEKQISRVFQNILANAIQSIPEDRKPEINIKVKIEESEISISICDNGIGMNKETQQRLFEPNFTTKNSGMGLGLAIVKQIVENNSGNISFTSILGKGSCFKIKFPQFPTY